MVGRVVIGLDEREIGVPFLERAIYFLFWKVSRPASGPARFLTELVPGVALRYLFLRVFLLSPFCIIPPVLPFSSIHLSPTLHNLSNCARVYVTHLTISDFPCSFPGVIRPLHQAEWSTRWRSG
jgi:hypothetical protein